MTTNDEARLGVRAVSAPTSAPKFGLRHPTVGKGAHAEQRGVSEQECDKYDQGHEKPPVEILFDTEGGAAAQGRAEGNVRCLRRKINPSTSQLAPTLGVDRKRP